MRVIQQSAISRSDPLISPEDHLIRRQEPVSTTEAASLALEAASSGMALAPNPQERFKETDITFHYSRDEPGPLAEKEKIQCIFEIDSTKGFGIRCQ